ncbi:MAG: hypothetical protein JWO83_4120 [Caulobacteraceae bacterium]|nr:hypothetical protein [Caulobacteraceae bacterium]
MLAVRCDLETKEMLIAAAPERFFDDDHYRGYPAVLVRLHAIDVDEFGPLSRAPGASARPGGCRTERGASPGIEIRGDWEPGLRALAARG